MVKTNGVKTETSTEELLTVSDIEDTATVEDVPQLVENTPQLVEDVPQLVEDVPQLVENTPQPVEDVPQLVEQTQDIDDILNSLKTLLSTVEKLQKVRQEVGDIKPLIGRMLDGELATGEELDQLKIGVSGLSRLVRAYSDHQTALAKAQSARTLLDQILKEGKVS